MFKRVSNFNLILNHFVNKLRIKNEMDIKFDQLDSATSLVAKPPHQN
jgi:hypothetical protein